MTVQTTTTAPFEAELRSALATPPARFTDVTAHHHLGAAS